MVQTYKNSLKCAKPRTQNEKQAAMAMVASDGNALEHVRSEFKSDKDIVLTAVKQNGCALRHASYKLRDHKDIVMAAVTQNGFALSEASTKLQADKDVVMAAITQNDKTYVWGNPSLKDDRLFILTAACQNIDIILWASPSLKNGGLEQYIKDIGAYFQFRLGHWNHDVNSAYDRIIHLPEIIKNIQRFLNGFTEVQVQELPQRGSVKFYKSLIGTEQLSQANMVMQKLSTIKNSPRKRHKLEVSL
jgi:hypothetical protein